MPMEREKHENLLAELLSADLEHSRRTEILQELRADYTNVVTEHEELSTTRTKLQAEKDDLIVSNSKLFRQIGLFDDPTKKKEEEKKDFSETITLESLEK